MVYDVGVYRNILDEAVADGDIVLEIGPHVGKGVKRYLKKTKLTVAVDKSDQAAKAISLLMERGGNLRFVLGDVRDFETIKEVLKLTKRCDIFAVDMGGGRYPDTVFKVWATWSGIFQPRHSIIRNRGLAEFLQRAGVRDISVIKKFEDNGWLSEWGRATPYTLKKQLKEFRFWVDIHKPVD